MNNQIIVRHKPFGNDPFLFLRTMAAALGQEAEEIEAFLPLAFSVSNAPLAFRLRLPSLLPGAKTFNPEFPDNPEFSDAPDIGNSGAAREIWERHKAETASAARAMRRILPDMDMERLMPLSARCSFDFMASLGAIRAFLKRRDLFSGCGLYSEDWENACFARGLLDNLSKINRELAAGLPGPEDLQSLALPGKNFIRISREAKNRGTSFIVTAHTIFPFHMMAEKPALEEPYTLASHDSEAAGVEIVGSGGKWFLSLRSNSRVDIFSGDPRLHGLRIYGEWEFHGMRRALDEYLQNRAVTPIRPRKHNISMIFDSLEDLNEFCFMFCAV